MISDELLSAQDGEKVLSICIGNSVVSLYLAEVSFSTNSFRFIDISEAPVETMPDPDSFRKTIMNEILTLETKNACRIKSTINVIKNNAVKSFQYKSAINKGLPAKITQYDVEKMLQNVIKEHTQNHPSDYILDIHSSKYAADEQIFDDNPVGMICKKISSKMTLFAIPEILFGKIVESFSLYNIKIIDCVPQIMCAYANLKRSNAMIIQIDEEESSCLCVKDGRPILIFSIPFGTKESEDTISKKFKISQPAAQRLVSLHVNASVGIEQDYIIKQSEKDEDYIINLGEGISQKEISTIARQSLRAIFARIKERLSHETIDAAIDLILITGDGAKIKGIDALCKDEFSIRSEIDQMPSSVPHSNHDPISPQGAYTASGAIKYIIEKRRRLNAKRQNKWLRLLPNKLSCFLEEVF